MPRYEVSMHRKVVYYTVVTVEAKSPKAARIRAQEISRGQYPPREDENEGVWDEGPEAGRSRCVVDKIEEV